MKLESERKRTFRYSFPSSDVVELVEYYEKEDILIIKWPGYVMLIDDAIDIMIALAKEKNKKVAACFNDVNVVVVPSSNPDDIFKIFWRKQDSFRRKLGKRSS